jgi:hypothetical protein
VIFTYLHIMYFDQIYPITQKKKIDYFKRLGSAVLQKKRFWSS